MVAGTSSAPRRTFRASLPPPLRASQPPSACADHPGRRTDEGGPL